METPVFFKNENYNLFGVLHEPDANKPIKLNQHKIGLVFCHPFAEEKLIAHRVMVNLARGLTEEGIFCLRFDEMGHGDSEGNFEDSTIETRLSDIRCAVDFLINQTGVEKICLLGVRFGATLAALTCADNTKIDALILISPLVEGKSYIEQCLRSNLTTQMMTYKKIIKDRNQLIADLMAGHPVNIDGYLLSKSLYQQIESINLLNSTVQFPQNILLLQIAKDEKQPFEKNLEKLYLQYKSQNDKAVLLNVKEDYFWKDAKIYTPQKRNLQEAVLNWLYRAYSS